MANQYREMLEKVRDLKIKKDDMPPLKYEDETDLIEDPVIISREHIINVLKRFKQERIDYTDLFDWIHFVWFSDLFSCKDEDADSIASVMELLEELEQEGDVMPEELEHCLYALENNLQVNYLLDHSE